MSKLKGKSPGQPKQPKKSLLLLGGILVFISVIIGSTSFLSSAKDVTVQATPKAAIIDQLYNEYPNQSMIEQMTKYLEDYGFQVDIYRGNEITVNFYRNLAQHGYNLLVIRSHSGAMQTDIKGKTIGTYLFTTESYSTLKYTKEQINGEILRASVESGYPSIFAIGPRFITDSMKGKLDNTIVIISGCSGLYSQDLANAFIAKGATAYMGWDKSVYLDYVDKATFSLIKNLCSNDAKVAKSVDLTMIENGWDPKSHAILKFYPEYIGNLTVSELTEIK